MKLINPLLRRLYITGDLPKEGTALDMGFGGGEDVGFLLDRGFDVTGVEKSEKAYTEAVERFGGKVTLLHTDIAEYEPEPNSFDLIIARNVLPFLTKQDALTTIEQSVSALKKDGYFLFTLFGPKDYEWKKEGKISTFEYDEAHALLEKLGLEIYFQSTEEGYGGTMAGTKKYWHIHQFIVRK